VRRTSPIKGETASRRYPRLLRTTLDQALAHQDETTVLEGLEGVQEEADRDMTTVGVCQWASPIHSATLVIRTGVKRLH
jgi:hypothetical protein